MLVRRSASRPRGAGRSPSRVTRIAWQERTSEPWKRRGSWSRITSSSSMKWYWPPGAGSGTKRGTTWAGRCTTAIEACGMREGTARSSDTTRHRERLARWGKGCPGSMASGVTIGSSVRRK